MNASHLSRLARLEAASRATGRSFTPAERRAAISHALGVEASLVAFYLGGWRRGDDGMARLLRGMAASTPQYMQPSLDWSAYRAEHAFSKEFGAWHSAERLNAAFEAIGSDRADLLGSIGDVLSRAAEIGDKALIGMAQDMEADAPSAEQRDGTPGNAVFLTEQLTITHHGTHSDG